MRRAVLFVDTPTYIGGAEISLLTLMEHLSADRYAPMLLTADEGPLASRARERGIPVLMQDFPWFSRRRPWRYAGSIYRLVEHIRSNRIALIHTNCDHSLRYVMYASKIARVPYVSHVRDFVRTWFSPRNIKALNGASYVIANSRAISQACAQAGIDPERTAIVYNPIDLDAFSAATPAARHRVRSELAIPDDAIVLAIVGHVQPMKGHEEFVRAAIRVARLWSQSYFCIVGGIPPVVNGTDFHKHLRYLVDRAQLADRFRFTGFRPDIPDVMAAIDILAVPSWSEPFGRVAVEGMAAGRAVIGTDTGGLPEIITDGVDGLLIPPRDADALEGAIRRLVMDHDLCVRLASEGRRSARRFTIAKHVTEMQSLYDRVLGERGRG